jgi:glycosyltransferase involved in cell wall biosynthesis
VADEWRDFVIANEIGVVCDTKDFSDLSAALKSFLSEGNRLTAMRNNGMSLIRYKWNYQRLFDPILQWMESGGR